MLAVAKADNLNKKKSRRDNVAILDTLTLIYTDLMDDLSVLKLVTSPNTLDMTAMGSI